MRKTAKSAAPQHVNITGLIALLKPRPSAPTFRKVLREHADFPVIRRGGKGNDWLFDPNAAQTWWAAFVKARPKTRGDQIRADRVRGGVRAGVLPANGGAAGPSVSQEKTQLEAALLRNRLRKESGELIEAKDLRPAVEQAVIRQRVAFAHLAYRAARRLGFSAEDQRVLQEMVDQCCEAFARELAGLDGDTGAPGIGDAQPVSAVPSVGAPREADGADQRR